MACHVNTSAEFQSLYDGKDSFKDAFLQASRDESPDCLRKLCGLAYGQLNTDLAGDGVLASYCIEVALNGLFLIAALLVARSPSHQRVAVVFRKLLDRFLLAHYFILLPFLVGAIVRLRLRTPSVADAVFIHALVGFLPMGLCQPLLLELDLAAQYLTLCRRRASWAHPERDRMLLPAPRGEGDGLSTGRDASGSGRRTSGGRLGLVDPLRTLWRDFKLVCGSGDPDVPPAITVTTANLAVVSVICLTTLVLSASVAAMMNLQDGGRTHQLLAAYQSQCFDMTILSWVRLEYLWPVPMSLFAILAVVCYLLSRRRRGRRLIALVPWVARPVVLSLLATQIFFLMSFYAQRHGDFWSLRPVSDGEEHQWGIGQVLALGVWLPTICDVGYSTAMLLLDRDQSCTRGKSVGKELSRRGSVS